MNRIDTNVSAPTLFRIHGGVADPATPMPARAALSSLLEAARHLLFVPEHVGAAVPACSASGLVFRGHAQAAIHEALAHLSMHESMIAGLHSDIASLRALAAGVPGGHHRDHVLAAAARLAAHAHALHSHTVELQLLAEHALHCAGSDAGAAGLFRTLDGFARGSVGTPPPAPAPGFGAWGIAGEGSPKRAARLFGAEGTPEGVGSPHQDHAGHTGAHAPRADGGDGARTHADLARILDHLAAAAGLLGRCGADGLDTRRTRGASTPSGQDVAAGSINGIGHAHVPASNDATHLDYRANDQASSSVIHSNGNGFHASHAGPGYYGFAGVLNGDAGSNRDRNGHVDHSCQGHSAGAAAAGVVVHDGAVAAGAAAGAAAALAAWGAGGHPADSVASSPDGRTSGAGPAGGGAGTLPGRATGPNGGDANTARCDGAAGHVHAGNAGLNGS